MCRSVSGMVVCAHAETVEAMGIQYQDEREQW